MASYHPLPPISPSFPQSITALAFDPVSDVLWAGSSIGTVVAYSGTRGARGVSFPVGGQLGVKKIVAEENSVKALPVSGDSVGSWAKGGMNKWHYGHSSNLTTFSNTPNVNTLVASTSELELLYLNNMTGVIVWQTQMPSLITHLQPSNSTLISGSADGYIRMHDPRAKSSRPSENGVKAHSGSIQGLQCASNLIFSIGLGERQSRPFVDPLVKVYDIRTMRPMPPITFSSGPALIHTLPKRPSSIAIISNQGLISIVDVLNPGDVGEFYQLDLISYVTSCAFSATSTYMAFGDAEGSIHLLSQIEGTTSVPFNGFDGHPVEWADTPAPVPDIAWSDTTPLNIIGIPHYDSRLLSAWTPQFSSSAISFPPPPKIPPQILNSIKTKDDVAYASLPRELRGHRNMVAADVQKQTKRFLSGKSRLPDEEPPTPTFDYSDSDVPRIYRRVEIEYSKFGVEDFDFGFYNKTEYSGLETHIFNSYTNSLVQLIHYNLPIRKLAKSHITTNCLREYCLLCELGFVIRMLEDARGTNCQASNFCKTVGILAQASNALEIVDYGRDSATVDHAHRIQTFHRFLIEHLQTEGNMFPHNPLMYRTSSTLPTLAPAPITQLFGIDGKNIITCMNCKAVRQKENVSHVIDLTYPKKGSSNESLIPLDFTAVLQHSLLRQMTHKATCQTCKQFATFSSRRSIPSQDLPPILAINACVYNEDILTSWLDSRGQTVLKLDIELHGQVDSVDDPVPAKYVLRGLILQIMAKGKPSHLVAIIKVPEAEKRSNLKSPWFIFNDFVVRNIPEEEALSFPDRWKVPAVLYYERFGLHAMLDYRGLPVEIDKSILCHDTSVSLNRDLNLIQHECLAPTELPEPGTLVAIDAEFVSMQQEETEFRSDGTRKVLRPARLSLARVSVLRGSGSKPGIPFIDDHIHTSEVIVDYLTEFSGIRFGDLDPHLSRHTLTPLKLVYKKLRLLVDRGCIFIGHGLTKDFRIINIYVPPKQVIDTVDLYFLPSRQRRLSLRFLSWFVLGEHIQTDTHDSIEDARSALSLYKAYHELDKGRFNQKLEELYKEGKLYNFKPPSNADPPPRLAESSTERSSLLAYPSTPAGQAVGGGFSTQGYMTSNIFNYSNRNQ